MISATEKVEAIRAAFKEKTFHADTRAFFTDNDELFQSLSPHGEGMVDGMFRAFAYLEAHEKEITEQGIHDRITVGEGV